MTNDVTRIFSIDIERLKRGRARQSLILLGLTIAIGIIAYELHLLEKYVKDRLD